MLGAVMLSVTYKPIMVSVVMLSVVAPLYVSVKLINELMAQCYKTFTAVSYAFS
jgi:hypothetical protein